MSIQKNRIFEDLKDITCLNKKDSAKFMNPSDV